MDSFLFYGDYAKQIQADNLQAIIGGNQSILDSIQKAAVEECRSYLKQKYDTDEALEAITNHNFSWSYLAGQTVYINASLYDPLAAYDLNSYTLHNGGVYTCSVAIIAPEAFTPANWTFIAPQNSTFYAVTPLPEFDNRKFYLKEDQIFYKNNLYTCKIATQVLDHQSQLEINKAVNSIAVNVLPDDPSLGVIHWGIGVPYFVPTNTSILDTTYWVSGDNRDQKLLMVCIDIALYHAHCRISPRNIPELRQHRYMGVHEDRINLAGRLVYPTYCALGWLQSAADGVDITAEMPILQSGSGHRIRFGGSAKLINQY